MTLRLPFVTPLLSWFNDLGMPKTRVDEMIARTGGPGPASPEQVAQFTERLRTHHARLRDEQ
jgi:hypothetical protein